MTTASLPCQLRGWFRLARVGLHLATAIITVAFVYPFVRQSVRLWLRQRWSRQLLGILGVHLDIARHTPVTRGLIVANHISWLDIYVIHALSPAAFVCKADVRDWPVIGWLCQHTDCIFIERGSRNAAMRTTRTLTDKLASGTVAAVFPEGTTSDGTRLLPFHGALLQAAIDAEVPVQPISLGYYDAAGKRTDAAAYYGDTSLLASIRNVVNAPALTVRAHILLPLAAEGRTRQELTRQARAVIEEALQRSNPSVMSPTPTAQDAIAAALSGTA